MSRKNNVNPDHYKIAGRDRPGENVVHEQQKESLARDRARQRQRADKPPAQRTPPATETAEEESGGDEDQ